MRVKEEEKEGVSLPRPPSSFGRGTSTGAAVMVVEVKVEGDIAGGIDGIYFGEWLSEWTL